MIQFTQPQSLNGAQLVEELTSAEVAVTGRPSIDGDGVLWLNIANADEVKAKAIVTAHIGIDQSAAIEAQRAAILERLGITADEAKLLIG
jgi:hypothetical protein